MAVQEHQKGESYDQAIQSYIPPGKLCPCHGDHDMFTPTVSPAHWKCARSKSENDQFFRSAAAVGSHSEETKGFADIEKIYGAAMAWPKTREYAKHLLAVLHNVKSNAYWLHIYCNGCRSYSRLMYVRAYDATQRSEAQEIANDIFQPYLDYFGGDKKGIDDRGTFSSQAAPQPSLPHVWSKDIDDCAWECWEKAIRRQDDDVLTRPHLQLYLADPPCSPAATDASAETPRSAAGKKGDSPPEPANQNRPLVLYLQAPPPPKTPPPATTTYPPPPPGAATSSQGPSQTAQGPPGAATSSEPPASSSASDSSTIMPTGRWRRRRRSPET